MGNDPASSVTEQRCTFPRCRQRLRPRSSVQPTIGHEPDAAAIALVGRLAITRTGHRPRRGPRSLFNGRTSMGGRPARRLRVVDGTRRTGGADLGLLWSTTPARPTSCCAAIGVNPSPTATLGCCPLPTPTEGLRHTAYVAVHFGFEVQIDDWRTGRRRSAPHGAIYDEPDQPSVCSRRFRPVSGTLRDPVQDRRTQSSSTESRSRSSPTPRRPRPAKATRCASFIGYSTTRIVAFRNIQKRLFSCSLGSLVTGVSAALNELDARP